MNRRAGTVMEEWDPFSIGSEHYNKEIADVVKHLHVLDHPSELAKKIQSIYESTLSKWIPLEQCVEVSYKLLAIKYEAKSII